MVIADLLRRLVPCLVAVSGLSLADPIDVGQVLGFTPGIHGAVELVFPSEVGKYYQVQISADMATWDNEGYSVKGTGGQVSVLARTRNLSNAYFRLRDDGDANNVAPVGPAGPAGSDASVTPSNLLEALELMNAGEEAAARDALQAVSGEDYQLNGSRLLSTPHAFAKVATGAPLRIVPVGDSMTTGFDISPQMAKRGFIGLTVHESLKTGTVINVSNAFGSWVNGEFQRFTPGSSGEFVPNGILGLNGYIQGNKAAIAYIARPGAGTFRLQSKTSAGATAVLAASIDATKDGNGNTVSVPTGVVKEYNLATSGYPSFRLVVDGVAGGDVDVIFGAIFPTTGGGATEVRTLMASRGGLEVSDSIQTPESIVAPIWQWLAPDVVFSLWADEGFNWESGGNWRTYYSRLKSAYPNSDFVQVSRNPSRGADDIATAQVAAQKAWAAETDEAFIDTQSLVGGTFMAALDNDLMARPGDLANVTTTSGSTSITFNDYGVKPDGVLIGSNVPPGTYIVSATAMSATMSAAATASASGQTIEVRDPVHLSATGTALRNAHIWKLLPLGQLELGAWGPDRMFRALAEPSATPAYAVAPQLSFTSGFRIPDTNPATTFDFWEVTSPGKVMTFKRGGSTYFTLSGTQDGLAGFYPGFDSMYLGNPSSRWRASVSGLTTAVVTKADAYTLTATDHTIVCTGAGGFTLTLPRATPATHQGRQYVIANKTSGNVTLAAVSDGTNIQKIDNATTLVINSGNTARISCVGNLASGDYQNWITW